MAVKPVNGRFNKPQSLAQLTRGRGWNSELVGFLLPFAKQDYIYVFDDFDADTLDDTRWELGTDAGSTAFAWQGLSGGVVTGATENTTNDYILIKGELIWDSAKNCGTEIRLKRDSIVTYKDEFGFSDPLTDDTLPALNDIDTPSITNGATDVAVICRDTSQTLTTYALVADGTTGAAASASFDTGLVPAAATYYRMMVQTAPNKSFGVFDNVYGRGVSVNQGPDSGTLVRPHYIVGTLANAVITVDIDYFAIWQER